MGSLAWLRNDCTRYVLFYAEKWRLEGDWSRYQLARRTSKKATPPGHFAYKCNCWPCALRDRFTPVTLGTSGHSFGAGPVKNWGIRINVGSQIDLGVLTRRKLVACSKDDRLTTAKACNPCRYLGRKPYFWLVYFTVQVKNFPFKICENVLNFWFQNHFLGIKTQKLQFIANPVAERIFFGTMHVWGYRKFSVGCLEMKRRRWSVSSMRFETGPIFSKEVKNSKLRKNQ